MPILHTPRVNLHENYFRGRSISLKYLLSDDIVSEMRHTIERLMGSNLALTPIEKLKLYVFTICTTDFTRHPIPSQNLEYIDKIIYNIKKLIDNSQYSGSMFNYFLNNLIRMDNESNYADTEQVIKILLNINVSSERNTRDFIALNYILSSIDIIGHLFKLDREPIRNEHYSIDNEFSMKFFRTTDTIYNVNFNTIEIFDEIRYNLSPFYSNRFSFENNSYIPITSKEVENYHENFYILNFELAFSKSNINRFLNIIYHIDERATLGFMPSEAFSFRYNINFNDFWNEIEEEEESEEEKLLKKHKKRIKKHRKRLKKYKSKTIKWMTIKSNKTTETTKTTEINIFSENFKDYLFPDMEKVS